MSTEAAPDRTRVARASARIAVRCAFFVNGAVFSSWFARIASVKAALHLADGLVGIATATPTLGALIAMQYTGRLTRRFGDRAMVCCGAVTTALSFWLLSFARTLPELLGALVFFGAAEGLLSVAMNAEAVVVERRQDRPVLNSCHAAWSFGAVAGSATSGWSIDAHWSFPEHAGCLTLCMLAITAATGSALEDGREPGERGAGAPSRAAGPEGARRHGWREGWSRMVLLIGTMGALCMLTEGSTGDWSGVFLHANRGMSLGTAAAGYIAFTSAETAVRTVGDRLSRRFGRVALVRAGALTGAFCLLMTAAVPVAAVSVAGFGLLGACLAVIVPIVYGAVGHAGAENDGHAAITVSRFTTLTYTSFLLGPPLIGWLATALSLPVALGALAAPLIWIGTKARAVQPDPEGAAS